MSASCHRPPGDASSGQQGERVGGFMKNDVAEASAVNGSTPTYHPLPDADYLPKLPLRERVARGVALQQEVPHERHGHWSALDSRPDPIALLERQSEERIPDLVPIRYGRMATSAFAFYR